MTRNFLAIPAAAVVLFYGFIPSRAANQPDNSQAQLTPASVAAHPQPLSDEDMARLLLVRKEYHGAEEIFNRLTIEQPTNALYWNELGISKHNQMQLGAALK
jgi:hypothetical protein